MAPAEKFWLERRRFPRLDWGFVVRFRAHKNEEDPWNASSIKNIGEGGCLFATDTQYENGQLLDIKVQFPMYRDPVEAVGRVIRYDGSDMAVEFVEINKLARSQFRDAVNFFLKKQQRQYRIE